VGLDSSAAELASALSPTDFVHAAKQAALRVGARFGAPASFDATPRSRWDVEATYPPPTEP
jgi:hypothetical protein